MSENPSSPRHPIRVVAHRTGLTAATIRAWERRYHAVEPARSESGQRLYSDRDVERLRTLKALTDGGRSIGSVASLSPEAAEALRSEDLEAPAPGAVLGSADFERWVADAFRHTTAMDGSSLERTLWRAFLSLGAKRFLADVAAPLLDKIGSEWEAGRVSPAQEHMGSAVLERVLSWMSAPALSSGEGPSIVVATLPGERHALGARLASAAAAVEGWRPTYLGADLPVDEIVAAARRVGAAMVAISAVRTDRVSETEESLVALRRALEPDVGIVVGGAAARVLGPDRLPPGVVALQGLDGLAELRRDARGPLSSSGSRG